MWLSSLILVAFASGRVAAHSAVGCFAHMDEVGNNFVNNHLDCNIDLLNRRN